MENASPHQQEAESGRVLGIDVGWSEKKRTTGVCLLAWDRSMITVVCRHVQKKAAGLRAAISELAGGMSFSAVAVDGPIRGSLDEIGVYRDAELMLTRGFQERIGKPGQSSSANGRKLNAAANAVAAILLDMRSVGLASHEARIHERAIVEAFPTSFLGVMLSSDGIPSCGARSDRFYEHLLGPDLPRPLLPRESQLKALLSLLLPNRRISSSLANIRDHEERAALVCAVTAICVVLRRYVAVGDRKNGYILLPPIADDGEPGLQPWAWEILSRNRSARDTDCIVVEPRIQVA